MSPARSRTTRATSSAPSGPSRAALKNTGSRLAVNEFSTVAAATPCRPRRRRSRRTTSPSPTPRSPPSSSPTSAATTSQTDPPTGKTASGWAASCNPARARCSRIWSSSSPTATPTRSSARTRSPSSSTRPRCRPRPVPTRSRTPNENPAADRAVSNSNGLKSLGSHVLALAVGDGLSSNSALNRLK